MNPKKHKSIVEITASQTEFSKEEIDLVMRYYYKKLQNKMRSCLYSAIQVDNFGIFVVKRKALESKIKKFEEYNKIFEKESSMRAFEMNKLVKIDLEIYNTLKDSMQLEFEKKMKIRKERYEK